MKLKNYIININLNFRNHQLKSENKFNCQFCNYI